MSLIAIDPGNEESAWVRFEHGIPVDFFKSSNNRIRESFLVVGESFGADCPAHLAIEMIASYGMPVGAEVFETCVWIGRFIEAWGGPYTLIYRREVKIFLCGDTKAKDGNIRQALIDKYGGKDKAIGKKASPGPLYGISADVWSALAVAVTWQGIHGKQAA